MRRLARLPFLAVRQLRWRRGEWSKDLDRTYHEQLYAAQDYDPFSPDYAGYVTIRRFADHVEPLIPSSGTVLDVGCGPGEITCELARRHTQLSFVGIDHSARAIERASRHAERLGLANARFQVGDAEQLPPSERYALVTMFDAFHHLERPREFLAWLRMRTSRCVLIEPAGTWSGRWNRGLDVDWLLTDLANIRDRLEAACGEPRFASEEPASTNGHAPPPQGEGAVERRYALEDFEAFFAGWHLRITGTIAGFDRYPPQPHARTALRGVTSEVTYELVRAVEALLQQRDRDGAAKHWVIAATTETGILQPRLVNTSANVDDRPLTRTVASAFDARYDAYDGPSRVTADSQFRATVGIVNAGWDEWRSDGTQPVRVSYHWLNDRGEVVVFDGLRSDLPRAIEPGATCRALLTASAPATPGSYILAIDLVKEGVAWFSDAGIAWLSVHVRVDAH